MRKSQLLSFALAGIVVLGIAGGAWGSVFVNPPETNPYISWQTQFPYQRNILLDFTTDPVGPTGPIPGADYEGYDDPLLWDSDFVIVTGDVKWDPAKEAIGIFGGGHGTLTVHIDNWDRPGVKHFYEEIILGVEGGTGWFYQTLVTPSSEIDSPDWYEVIGHEIAAWYKFPNPPWEEKVFTFTADPGNSIYIESLHIATECIPEPTTFIIWSLLGGLGITIGWWRWKR